MQEKAILFSEMTPMPEWEADFNAWYDEEHIPIRMDAPGFVGAQRYKRNARDYLAVYDMDDTSALTSEAYKEIKENPSERTAWMLKSVNNFSRYIGRPIGQQVNPNADNFLDAPVLYPVFFNVPENRIEEFDKWYDEDHVPTLLECGAWLACRRFAIEIAEPLSFNRLALHYLKDASALDSKARQKARQSEWRDRLAEEEWFKGSYLVFDCHGERFVPPK